MKLKAAFLTAGAAALVLASGVRLFKIDGGSMNPALEGGDYVVVNKFAYRLSSIRRGDVVLFRFPSENRDAEYCGEKVYGKDFIKRVVGLPGEEFEIKQNSININGKFLEQDAANERLGPLTLARGAYFVMGDNRIRSCDSRIWGSLPRSYVRGKAWFILWPSSRRRKI